MNVSFGPESGNGPAPVIDVPATVTPAPAQAAAPAPAPAAQPVAESAPADAVRPFPEGSVTAVQHAAKTGGLMLGDTIPDFKDIILPRLNIVQGVGNLKDQFVQGALVFNQSTVLFEPADVDVKTGAVKRAASAPVTITVLGFRPSRFVEKIAGGAKGLIVNTEAEVKNNGGTTNYKEWDMKKGAGMKYFQVLAEALIAIERPETIADDDTVFNFECEGKKYALAIWALKGSAYTAAAKRVFFTHRSIGCLRQGYPTHSYSVTTRLEPFENGNKAWVPVCVPKVKNTPGFLKFVEGIIAAPEVPNDGTENA